MTRRVERIVVTVVVSDYDDAGHLVNEQQSDPISLFRGSSPDVWAALDSKLPPLEDAKDK